jgi:hypothetical protein
MIVRMLIGRYAGEIRDIAPGAARAMLEAGRAEDPYAPALEPEPEAEAAAAPARRRPKAL